MFKGKKYSGGSPICTSVLVYFPSPHLRLEFEMRSDALQATNITEEEEG